MIIKHEKINVKPRWKKSEYNRWADYIELLCLKDEVITPDDVIDIWCDDDTDNEYDRGGLDHLEKSAYLEMQIDDYFILLHSREKACGEYYPFEMQKGNCLKLKQNLSDKQKIYIFLLLCSSICFMDNIEMKKYTDDFEVLSKSVMHTLVPRNAVVELFGTTRKGDLFCGTQRKRIEKLADCIGARTTKSFDENEKYDLAKAGDDGLDIVAYLPIDDAQMIPFAFAQCTCSFDKWKEKQDSVLEDHWNTKIEPLVSYPAFMFVPFSCHNSEGAFYDVTAIRSFLIDRIRIIKLYENTKDNLVECEITKLVQKNSLSKIWS